MKYKFFDRYIDQTKSYAKYKDYLFFEKNTWDDYGFRTLFEVYIPKDNGNLTKIGAISITKPDAQATISKTYIAFKEFDTDIDYNKLPEDFISLGTEDFYYNLHKFFNRKKCQRILSDLQDICISWNNEKFSNSFDNVKVINTSFFRSYNKTEAEHRFQYILKPLADRGYRENYNLTYTYSIDKTELTTIKFHSNPESIFPQNVHAIIGKNGSGKTTFIKDILSLSMNQKLNVVSHFKKDDRNLDISFSTETGLKINTPEDYFSKIILISFSPFDNLYLDNGNAIQNNKTSFDNNSNIKYLGLYKKNNELINSEDQFNIFFELIDQLNANEDNWLFFQELLKNQDYQGDILTVLNTINGVIQENSFRNELKIVFDKMSAGQKIITLSIATLVKEVEQFSLVLIDEPELFLHPPMISNYIRSISEIMHKKNGFCILSTHSPIIIQEIPKDCVKIINSNENGGLSMIEPQYETLGENLSTLTNTIFELNQYETGFYKLIKKLITDLDESEFNYDEFEKLKFGRDGMLYKDLLLSDRYESEED